MAAFPVTPLKNMNDQEKNKNFLAVPPAIIESDKD
jgi:hypothetical protein